MDGSTTAGGAFSPDHLIAQLGDEGLAAEVVGVYADELPGRLAALEGARGALTEDTVRVAHSLKSASAMLGLAGLSARCAELEQRARAGDGPGAVGAVDDVLAAAEGVEVGLRRWLADRAGR